jgi:hypothetical protein
MSRPYRTTDAARVRNVACKLVLRSDSLREDDQQLQFIRHFDSARVTDLLMSLNVASGERVN